jgi:hypothetical protein
MSKPKLLIAVVSCARDQSAGGHSAITSTWGKEAARVGIGLKFFVGTGAFAGRNEIWVDAPDSYQCLPAKVKAMCEWFVRSDYDYLFKCDNDTFIHPERLLGMEFESADCSGHQGSGSGSFNGGVGYFLSKKAAEIVSKDSMHSGAEDVLVAQVLKDKVTRTNLHYPQWATWHYPKLYGWKYLGFQPSSMWQKRMTDVHIHGADPFKKVPIGIRFNGMVLNKEFQLCKIDRDEYPPQTEKAA